MDPHYGILNLQILTKYKLHGEKFPDMYWVFLQKTGSYLLLNLMKSRNNLCLIYNRIINFFITGLVHKNKYISDVFKQILNK